MALPLGHAPTASERKSSPLAAPLLPQAGPWPAGAHVSP
jgi:hypothetical protein